MAAEVRRISPRRSDDRGPICPCRHSLSHLARMTSGAPLMYIVADFSSPRTMTDIALRSESNGISWSTRSSLSRASTSALSAATIRAPSVGSPMTCQTRSSSGWCNLCRVAPRRDLQRPHQIGPLLRVDRFANGVRVPFDAKVEVAARLIARSADVMVGTRGDDLAHRHFVAGQCAGLVRADDRDGAQRLDARQPSHQGVAPTSAASRSPAPASRPREDLPGPRPPRG